MYKKLKLKIPPPVVALICALLIWKLADVAPIPAIDQGSRRTIALILFPIAACIDIQALFSFRGAQTTIDPRYPHKTTAMVATGIYRFTRNPMYLSLVCLLTALTLWLNACPGLIIIAGFIFYINYFQIAAEEQALESLFGDDYLNYKARVRRWL